MFYLFSSLKSPKIHNKTFVFIYQIIIIYVALFSLFLEYIFSHFVFSFFAKSLSQVLNWPETPAQTKIWADVRLFVLFMSWQDNASASRESGARRGQEQQTDADGQHYTNCCSDRIRVLCCASFSCVLFVCCCCCCCCWLVHCVCAINRFRLCFRAAQWVKVWRSRARRRRRRPSSGSSRQHQWQQSTKWSPRWSQA